MSVGRAFRTVSHLRGIQIANRITRRFRPMRIDRSAAPPRRLDAAFATSTLGRRESLFADGLFRLLNEERYIATASAWNEASTPKLWLYTLHYHDGLRCPSTPQSLKDAMVARWLHDNPPGHGNGWEPYPLSLRIVNWITAMIERQIDDGELLASLATQVRALASTLEYHLLGNHLWANAKALIFAGIFFEGPEADEWRRLGFSIADEQRAEQFLADGGHFELSTSYHAIMLEDVLDLVNLARGTGIQLDRNWTTTAERALTWLGVMTRADGLSPLFNDAFHDVAPTYAQLADYASRQGIAGTQASQVFTPLAASGYYRWDNGNMSAWIDCGRIGPDYLPGHGHADCLNFELSCCGQPIVVDTGTSTYQIGARRNYERGTSAHNTITIDGCDQAEMWGGFRVGRRPSVQLLAANEEVVAAKHDGYEALGISHMRRFEFGRTLRVVDELAASRRAAHRSRVARFHLAPGIMPHVIGNVVRAANTTIRFEGALEIAVEDYEAAHGFNDLRAAKCLTVTTASRLVTEFSCESYS